MKTQKEPLLALVDGAILEFNYDHDWHDGCGSCDYGSSYIQEFIVITTEGRYHYKFGNMYENLVSEQFLFETILPNADAIKAMTIDELDAWLVKTFQGRIDKDCRNCGDLTEEFTHWLEPA